MKKTLIAVGLALVLLAALIWMRPADTAVAPTGFAALLDRQFLQNPYWNDGKAEVNLYRATLSYYRQPRETDEVVHILVTEDHDPQTLVKALDWKRSDLLKVLKFNLLRRTRTGVYEYREMLSAFLRRDRQELVKMSFTSQEWCGTSFKELVHFDGRGRFAYHTYWEGQADGDLPLPLPDDVALYDSLPLQLRGLAWSDGLTAELNLIPSQISSRAPLPEVERAKLRIEGMEEIEVPAGVFACRRVTLDHGPGIDTFWFETAFPHRMIRQETAKGDVFSLRLSKRLDYWNFNGVGDAAHLE